MWLTHELSRKVPLVGFTPLSESRDPEEVREILSRYFDVARRLISRHGGVVEKFIGDAVMAVWGAPVAEEGDTERAVRAALELVSAVGALGAEVSVPDLAARAGVVTGEVAVTIGATGEGMVAGDAVNTASRVQSVARPGSVLCDDATKRLAESAIAFEDGGLHELKGKECPEQLHRAMRVLSQVGGKQRAGGLEAPFVGRDGELRTLKELFHTAVERRSPRLVVVSGPAGAGKSRLGWEFEKYIDGIAEVVLWHRGRCLSYGEGVAFWALAEVVRQRFGIAEEDATSVAKAKLAEGMVRFVQTEGERDYVGVRLSRLLGVPFESETKVVLSTEELFAGWRLFFERLAQVAPVVVLLEDAHHADESLLGFVEHLIDWTRDLPIFVLLFARPGLDVIDEGYGVGRNRSTLSLDPLDDASMARLVDALVPSMPVHARDAITARAQGIPLFAVETVRSLIDQGVVKGDGEEGGHAGTYRLVGDLGELKVPESLHALLAARLDALPPEVRSLVADASVVGTSFPKEAVIAVSGRDAHAVEAGLGELVRRDVLQVFADPLSPERGSYRFSQEMLRQVAYETLSKKDRRARHLAIAAHLRTAFANDGEEIADAIARHYLDALAAGPQDHDVDDVTANASAFLVRAAERAERSGAPAVAAETYAKAAAIATTEAAPGLFERAANASNDYGDYEAAIEHAETAHRLFLDHGEPLSAARVQALKGRALSQGGRYHDARREVTEALRVLRPDPSADTVRAIANLTAVEVFSGKLGEGRELASEALSLAQALDVGAGDLADLFNLRGIAAAMGNLSVEAAVDFEASVRLAERAGDLAMVSRAQSNLASVLILTDPRGAVEAARSAFVHAQRTGRRNMLSHSVTNLVVALLELGEWDEADAVYEDVVTGQPLEHEVALRTEAWLAGLRGEGGRAVAALGSIPGYRQSEERQAQTEVAFLDAVAALCSGDVQGALAHAMAVLGMREDLGFGIETMRWSWPLAARAARALGNRAALVELVAMLGAHPVGHLPPILRAEHKLVAALVAADAAPDGALPDAQTVASLADAVAALREVGNPYELAHGLIDHAEVLARWQLDGAEDALSEARQIAERLRCPPLLERAGAVAARSTAHVHAATT